jgi:hypothetical protein
MARTAGPIAAFGRKAGFSPISTSRKACMTVRWIKDDSMAKN